MTLAEQIASLKGATIENVSAKLNKEGNDLLVLTLFLADGRRVGLWSYVSEYGDYMRPAESSMEIEIDS